MSGGESCAITLPSTNSTIEWTTLSGWITTSTCSGSSWNSQRASMTSRALFIRVAESIVIFGPICQVGCFRASSGVTSASSRADRPRNGPPEEVRITRRTSLRRPAWSAWKIAECSLSTGNDPRAPRSSQLHHQRTGDDQRLLVRQRHDLAGLERRPRPSQTRPPRRSRSRRGRSPGPGPSSPGRPVRKAPELPCPAAPAPSAATAPDRSTTMKRGRCATACSARACQRQWALSPQALSRVPPSCSITLRRTSADRARRAEDHDVSE